MTFWRHPHNWQCKVSILLPLFGTIARIILLLILAFIKKFFSKKLFVDFKILKIYKVFELIYKTGRSSIKKFLSGCILTRVWISWGRPSNKQHQRHKIFIKQYKFSLNLSRPALRHLESKLSCLILFMAVMAWYHRCQRRLARIPDTQKTSHLRSIEV